MKQNHCIINRSYFVILFSLTTLFVLLMLFFRNPVVEKGAQINVEIDPELKEKLWLENFVKQEYEDRRTDKIPKPHSVLPSNSIQYPKPYLFLHIPKTAGTTLSSVFQKNDPKGFQHFWLHPHLNELSKLQNKNAVFGHFRYGLHRYFNRTCTYITMLRDPVDRVVSHYYYHRMSNARATNTIYQLAKNSTLKQWVELSPSANNEMTRCLSGIRQSETIPTNQTLQIALQHLKDFGFVGLTEKFHESLVLMKYSLGFTYIKYTKSKQSKRAKLKEIPQADYDYIKKVNWMDTLIYEEGVKIFNQMLENAPPTFSKDLDDFNKEMAKSYKPLL